MWKKKYSPLTKNNIVDFIAEIFERCGDEEYLGEPVTMAEHMLQGANFAQKRFFNQYQGCWFEPY